MLSCFVNLFLNLDFSMLLNCYSQHWRPDAVMSATHRRNLQSPSHLSSWESFVYIYIYVYIKRSPKLPPTPPNAFALVAGEYYSHSHSRYHAKPAFSECNLLLVQSGERNAISGGRSGAKIFCRPPIQKKTRRNGTENKEEWK